VVDSFLFFSGEVEFSLAASDRFICAHSSAYVTYEFWECVRQEPATIMEIVISKPFTNFLNKRIFHILQETWPFYKDPYVRSALFFILNRCSSTGAISSGDYDPLEFTPIALTNLRKFAIKNFHLQWDQGVALEEAIQREGEGEYLLIPLPAFSYNFFQEGKSLGFEEERVDHQKLKEVLAPLSKKWILTYPFHPAVLHAYKSFNIHMLNKYGNLVEDQTQCEEIIVTNF
tara:strand:- start:749 stop:1438 length:690 start_codon:yes stop_codon:yes gene_type:complete